MRPSLPTLRGQMIRRLFLSRNVSLQQSVTRFRPGRRNVSVKTAVKKLADSGPPVLARFPLVYTTFWFLKCATGFVLTVHIFVDYFYAIHATWGISMVPTMAASGDSVLISKYYRHGRGVKIGDIVSFKHPLKEDMRVSKRILGMPGDFVLRDSPETGRGMMIQVPQGHCWVVGDNLDYSRDSRMYGPIPLALVRGKIIAIFRGWSLIPERVPDALMDSTYDPHSIE